MADFTRRRRNRINLSLWNNISSVLLFKLQELFIYASCIPTSTNNSDPLRTSVFDKSRRDKEVVQKYVVATAIWGTRQLLDQVKDYSLSLVPSISCFNRSTELPRDFDAYKPILFARNILVL
jgi:hypothetical protein